jgi:hypothetical protein
MYVDAINIFGVSAGALASFRFVSRREIPRFPSQVDFWAWFDSRQLHRGKAGQGRKPWPVFFFINTDVSLMTYSSDGLLNKFSVLRRNTV